MRLSQPAWPSHATYQQCLQQLQAAGPLASVLAVEAPVPDILQVIAASTHGCCCACSEGNLLLSAVASLLPLQLICAAPRVSCLPGGVTGPHAMLRWVIVLVLLPQLALS